MIESVIPLMNDLSNAVEKCKTFMHYFVADF